MGNDSPNFQQGRERNNGIGLHVLHPAINNRSKPYKIPKKTMEGKLLMFLFTAISSFGYGLVILLNIDNVKGLILFIIAVLYGIARLIFYCIKQNQDRRMRELDIIEKQRRLYDGDTI